MNMLDFNDAPDTLTLTDTSSLREDVLDRLEALLWQWFPQGHTEGQRFHIGDIHGARGRSLAVELAGDKRGLWTDFSTGDGGDVIDLWAAVHGLSPQCDFAEIAEGIKRWLGMPHATVTPRSKPVADDLGHPTGRWDYRSVSGELIACVYRYDTPRGKQYRPWDVRMRVQRAPDPRPLFNLPVISQSTHVVIVEGEKCAEALISLGVAATTTMNGAKAPIGKTDWQPLRGKHVLIWPDRDAPGWDYAESVAKACTNAGAISVAILLPPDDKPEKWDAADALAEGFDCLGFLQHGERQVIKLSDPALPTYTLGQLLDDHSPIPEDLIAPRVVTVGGLWVIAGAPKVGKSDFLLNLLTHVAAGAAFLGLTPPRPLRVFYLQAEVQYHFLRERAQEIKLPEPQLTIARDNLVVTPQLRCMLDDDGLAQVIPTIRNAFAGAPADLIVLDPIRNLFDGGDAGGENDNGAMMFFLSQRVQRIQWEINPDAGIILVHHTRKIGKKQFEEDPFQALSGASALRAFYSSGLLLYRADETQSLRQMIFELRNGPGLPIKYIDKVDGRWIEVDHHARLVKADYGERLDAERRRKHDVILEILYEEGLQGHCYTANQFAETFEGRAGLGGDRTIRDRIAVLTTQGYIKFFRDAEAYGLDPPRSKYGYLCVEGMVLRRAGNEPDLATGELNTIELRVYPTHYKDPKNGALMPVENPFEWVYPNTVKHPMEAK